MKTLLGFFVGAIAAWALGVLVLHLPWETTLLLIEVAAVTTAVISGVLVHRRHRLVRQKV